MASEPFPKTEPEESEPSREPSQVLDATRVEPADVPDSGEATAIPSAEDPAPAEPFATAKVPVGEAPAEPAPASEWAEVPVDLAPEAGEPVVEEAQAEDVPTDEVLDTAAVAAPVEVAVVAVPEPAADDPVSVEQARLARERAARKEARMAALAPVLSEEPVAPVPVAAVQVVKRVTDGFWGSFGLFALRLVAAFSLFVQGFNGVINRDAATQIWANTVLPYPSWVAFGVSAASLVVALMLLFGLATRLAGLLAAGLMGATLAFVMWGPWSIFEAGGTGFLGERELLVAVIGFALLVLGAGAWSIDYGIRRARSAEGLSD